MLPVLAACWPQGAQTAGSVPWKIIQFKRKETPEAGSRSTANISSGNSLPHSNKGFCCALRECSPFSVPPRTDKVLPEGKMFTPCRGAQGTTSPGDHHQRAWAVTQPRVHVDTAHAGWVRALPICWRPALKRGISIPPGRICASYLSLALVYG